MAHQIPSIDLLLNLVPEKPSVVQEKLRAHPTLAAKQDAHGYSLVHAAASYGHESLLRFLITEMGVDVNLRDEDAETALFSVEEVRMAEVLVELGVDVSARNCEGKRAVEKLDGEDEVPEVAAFLRGREGEASGSGSGGGIERPPPLPKGLQLNVGTMSAAEAGEEPDPEFRRRIEELAADPDFQGEAGQRALRELVMDAVSGLAEQGGGDGPPPASRRRVG